ncbi:hypothetical protein WN943_011013 [Citrus x changshan-huyou]
MQDRTLFLRPLKRVLRFKLKGSEEITTLPQLYESLPDFYFKCGCLGNLHGECYDPVSSNNNEGSTVQPQSFKVQHSPNDDNWNPKERKFDSKLYGPKSLKRVRT